MPPDTERSPAWHNKPFTLSVPSGLIALLITALVSAGSAGAVGAATRQGDLSAVDARIDARVEEVAEQIRREVAASDRAADALAAARYDEILRRLDRIERRMDGSP